MDPLRLVTQIVTGSSRDENDLDDLKTSLEQQPSRELVFASSTKVERLLVVPLIAQTILPSLNRVPDDLKVYLLDEIIANALSRPNLAPDQKTSLAQRCLDPFASLLQNPNPRVQKLVIQCFTDAYPLLFRQACNESSQSAAWEKTTELKNAVFQLWNTSSIGPRVAATKFVQRVIQTQTRAVVDPRIRQQAEPNLAMCPSHHTFMNAQVLEDEAKRLLEECIKLLYISAVPDLVSCIVNSFAVLVKARPALSNSIYTSLVNWEPNGLALCTPLQVRGVEKTFRIAVAHLARSGSAAAFATQITEFLTKQNTRMQLAAEASRRKRDEEASRKRTRITDELNSMAGAATPGKRRKTDSMAAADKGLSATQTFAIGSKPGEEANPLADFDVTTLPVTLVTELIIANLQVVTDATLAGAINEIRKHISTTSPSVAVKTEVKEGPINPLAEEEEDLQLPDDDDESEDEAEPALPAEDFELPLGGPVSLATHTFFFDSAISRVFSAGLNAAAPSDKEAILWIGLITRMASTCSKASDDPGQPDTVRQALLAYVLQEPASRLHVAKIWFAEEWNHAGQPESTQIPYESHLHSLLDQVAEQANFDSKLLPPFLVDLPQVSRPTCERLAELCQKPDRLTLGFPCLRELAVSRFTTRSDALDMLLALATHPEKPTRNAAILTMKRWVPELPALSEIVLGFVSQLLKRLEQYRTPTTEPEPKKEEGDGAMAIDEEEKLLPRAFATVKDAQIVADMPAPDSELHVTQHVELLFALSTKASDLLNQLFTSYCSMEASVQAHVEKAITMLIRSMGAKNPKILELIRSAPAGAESLALRVITILSEKGKVSPALVEAVKEMMAAKEDMDPRYLVLMLPEYDKPEIIKNLPRIVGLLSGQEQDRTLVTNVFENILEPPETFGVPSNVPRTTRSDLLTPVELLAELHNLGSEVPLKKAVDAIGLCLSMTEVFKPNALAAFMQQVMDQPTLPLLYLRTVIQIATMYRPLQPFISTTLMNRLITKKVWTNPQQWEGFIRLAKATEPHCFEALLQLPKEALQQLLSKQSSLREPLQVHIGQRYSNNPNRMRQLMEATG